MLQGSQVMIRRVVLSWEDGDVLEERNLASALGYEDAANGTVQNGIWCLTHLCLLL